VILEDWKIRVSVLWLFYAVASLAYGMLGSSETGAIAQAGPELLMLAAGVGLIQLTMAFLSVTLRDSLNRWANIIVGGVFAVLELFPLGDAVVKLSGWATLIMLGKVAATALVVWFAWKSKQKA